MKVECSATYIPDDDQRPHSLKRCEIWTIFDRKGKCMLQYPYMQNELGVRRFIAQLLTMDNSLYRDNVSDFYAVRIGALVCSETASMARFFPDGDTIIEFSDLKSEIKENA